MTSPSSTKINTRFLILSDTHNAIPPPASNTTTAHENAFISPLPAADVLLHCGDLTMVGQLHEYEAALSLLSSISAELKLVIAGNHDITLDEEYYARAGQRMHRLQKHDPTLSAKAKELWTGERARQAGVTYLEEGTYTFKLSNGAKLRVYASPYQPEFCDWAFPYFRNEDRFNPPHACTPFSRPIASSPVPDFPAIDIMMTHGPPMGIRDETTRSENVGCEHLLRAARRARPKLHCFGHIHEGWGAEGVVWRDVKEGLDVKNWKEHLDSKEWVEVDEEKMRSERAAYVDARGLAFGKETLMINASIMTVRYKPQQGPWLVDLDLEKAD